MRQRMRVLATARGDELPPELAERASRRARLRRCKEQLEAEQAASRPAMRPVWPGGCSGRQITGERSAAAS